MLITWSHFKSPCIYLHLLRFSPQLFHALSCILEIVFHTRKKGQNRMEKVRKKIKRTSHVRKSSGLGAKGVLSTVGDVEETVLIFMILIHLMHAGTATRKCKTCILITYCFSNNKGTNGTSYLYICIPVYAHVYTYSGKSFQHNTD